jgi:hypothetical protein
MQDRAVSIVARGLLACALGFTLYMAFLPHPPPLPIDAWGDKVEHSLAFVSLTILACAGFPNAALVRIGERLSFLGAIIEVVQSIPALHRDCDILDWLTDTGAIAAVLLIVGAGRLFIAKRQARS